MIKKFSYILSLSLLFIFSCTKENLLSSDTSASQKDVFDIAEEEGLIGISITAVYVKMQETHDEWYKFNTDYNPPGAFIGST